MNVKGENEQLNTDADEQSSPDPSDAGEDDASTEREGEDGHLHDDQKSDILGDGSAG